MRGRPVLLLGVVALVAGCGGEGGTAASDGSTTAAATTTVPPAPECPAPVAIASAADLVAVLAATPWRGLGLYTSGPLPVTPDLVVTGTVVLEAADLPVPEDCRARPDCRPDAAFRMGVPLPGVVPEGVADFACSDGFARLTLTDTTVRLRPYLYDTHPCEYNLVPLVAVLPPCGTACPEGEALCPVDGVCYAAGEGFCRLCEGGAKEACACRGSEGPLPEGSACSYWRSGDVLCEGRCRQGTCVSRACP